MLVHPDFHWRNILATVFVSFTDKFSNFLSSFTDKIFFSQWLHLNNLCHESIAQDGMGVLRIFFAMATSKLHNLTWSVKLAGKLSHFCDHEFTSRIATNGQQTFLSVKVGWHKNVVKCSDTGLIPMFILIRLISLHDARAPIQAL